MLIQKHARESAGQKIWHDSLANQNTKHALDSFQYLIYVIIENSTQIYFKSNYLKYKLFFLSLF